MYYLEFQKNIIQSKKLLLRFDLMSEYKVINGG